MTGPDKGSRLPFVKGELGSAMRFGLVGIAATLTYLGMSLLLLGWGMAPQLANLAAFLVSTAASYLGHYFFTYRVSGGAFGRDTGRAAGSHLRLSTRFIAVTILLTLFCSALHQLVLWAGASPRQAAFAVTISYPPLSFLFNHFWAFSRGSHAQPESGSA